MLRMVETAGDHVNAKPRIAWLNDGLNVMSHANSFHKVKLRTRRREWQEQSPEA
jgi:hypothetical protein